MTDWLKYFFLSFFTDKYIDESHKRSLANAFFALFLSLAIIMFMLFGGFSAAMSTHYNAAESYRQAIYGVLTNDSYDLEITDKELLFTENGDPVLINTYDNGVDDNCEIIIDTRDIKTSYVRFSVSCTVNGEVIKYEDYYEEYLALSEEEQSGFTFDVELSDELIVFDSEQLLQYEGFLSGVEDDDVKASYEELDKTADDYATQLYKIYATAYYPNDVLSTEIYSFAPTLRSYYDDLTGNSTNDFFAVYNDLIYSKFTLDKNVEYYISAFASYIENGTVGKTQQDVDELITSAFSASSTYILLEYIINFMRLIPVWIILALIISVIPWLIFKFTKTPKLTEYFTSFKIINIYGLVAALVAGILGFAFSWLIGRSYTYQLALICFIAIVVIRLVVFIVCRLLQNKKQQN